MKKIISNIGIFLMSIFSTFAVEVITNPNIQDEAKNNEALRSAVITIFGIGLILVIIAFVIFLIAMIIMKIQKKIRDIDKKKKDFLYYTFEDNLNFCHNNRDKDLKYKKLKTLFLVWHREPIYIETSNGMREIGFYDGETYKKENFYMVGLYNKVGMFKVMRQIILIPNYLKDSIVRKEFINGKKTFIIKCEGIDEVGNTDYYVMPLIRDAKKPKEFLDFADYIHKNFFEKIVYRDLIKENLLEYREGIIKSVEMNPNLQFKRRGE